MQRRGRQRARVAAEEIVLGYFLGPSQSEIARELGVPLGTVKKRVRLGMQKVRLALADGQEAPRLRVVVDE